uniref:ORF25 n=1 Tax=Cydia pomonella granulosis virus TaxID=28289 RepID=A0A5B8HCR3_GVCP|nr:ORF25 [Cydia pomonella granulovirus]
MSPECLIFNSKHNTSYFSLQFHELANFD